MAPDEDDADSRQPGQGPDGSFDAQEDQGPRREVVIAFLTGLLVGAVVLGLGWFVATGLEEDPDEAQRTSARIGRTASPSPTSPAAPTTVDRCAEAATDLTDALSLAQPAMAQWSVHIGAMNQLVVGAITLDQATAFWEETRLGAQRRISRFRAGMRTLRSEGVDCPSPDLAPSAPGLRACARQVGAQLQAVRRARTSVATWDEHVMHMDMLRLGTLSPEDATEMWLSTWRDGADDLRAYRLAARKAQRSPVC